MITLGLLAGLMLAAALVWPVTPTDPDATVVIPQLAPDAGRHRAPDGARTHWRDGTRITSPAGWITALAQRDRPQRTDNPHTDTPAGWWTS
ncbi:MAG: hypothetical protein HYR62_02045 [Actinobacteria bacterium]|nr:hypothetical protein [Actinomycetota bacterium]MBI3687265.1 hypothetical protein [Actinomycetota bacterium]